MLSTHTISSFFFFNDTATTEIYTLSLHDALPIYREAAAWASRMEARYRGAKTLQATFLERYAENGREVRTESGDRKSTRLNSSHSQISYAVFCLKKKKIEHVSQFNWKMSDRHILV